MPTLSKLDSICEKCNHKDTCNKKRMVACALAEMPKNNMKEASRKYTLITINMGEYGKIETSLEELKEI